MGFNELDVSGDGKLSIEEFEELLNIDQVSAWMDLLDISTKDVDELFRAVDDGDGQISMSEFVKGFERMQGGATAVDAMSLMSAVNRVDRQIAGLREFLQPKC